MTPSAATLSSLFGVSLKQAAVWVVPFELAAERADLNTSQRMACFLAQVGHESGNLHWLTELWGPTPQQMKYELPNPLAGRLGNSQVGDGFRYRGRGLIQLTGRANFAEMAQTLEQPLLEQPALLSTPKLAALSAAYFWKKRNLNRYADSFDFAGLTKKINGGYNGLAHRQALYTKAITLC